MIEERVGSLAWLRKQVEDADKDLLREIVKGVVETLMGLKRTASVAHCVVSQARIG